MKLLEARKRNETYEVDLTDGQDSYTVYTNFQTITVAEYKAKFSSLNRPLKDDRRLDKSFKSMLQNVVRANEVYIRANIKKDNYAGMLYEKLVKKYKNLLQNNGHTKSDTDLLLSYFEVEANGESFDILANDYMGYRKSITKKSGHSIIDYEIKMLKKEFHNNI